MSEGPVNFGKPLLFLVIAACAGGGYYAYNNWPAHYAAADGGWEIDFPHGWEATPFNDPASPGKVVASGPTLQGEVEGKGVGWVTVNFHGQLAWPDFAIKNVPGTIDKQETNIEIAHKKAFIFEYEADGIRYRGSAVQRGDAVIICAIGCQTAFFAQNLPKFEKTIQSIRCNR